MSAKVASVVVAVSLMLLPVVSGVEYAGVHGQRSKQQVEVSSFERFQRAAEQSNTTTQDTHSYYISTYHPSGSEAASNLWLELSSGSSGATEDTNLTESVLSGLHRHYEVNELKFQFPFYGHTINAVAVTTGGFLYTGGVLHDKIHLTQFIAPLQADFNPSANDTARILVLSTEERFTVQWDQVHNHDHITDGPFTFQVSLFPNGEIHFVYKEIPLLVSQIDNDGHPVEVGLADAFYVVRSFFGGLIRIDIYEYHRVELNQTDNLEGGAYVLTPLPNCVSATSCQECSDLSQNSTFQCAWCDELKRCSDGVDRFRQDWVESGCTDDGTTECKPAPPTSPPPSSPSTTFSSRPPTPPPSISPTLPSRPPTAASSSKESSALSSPARIGISVGIIVFVLLALLVLLVMAVLCYGYRRPTSKLGIFMIEHRRKTWSGSKEKSSATYDVGTEKAILEENVYT